MASLPCPLPKKAPTLTLGTRWARKGMRWMRASIAATRLPDQRHALLRQRLSNLGQRRARGEYSAMIEAAAIAAIIINCQGHPWQRGPEEGDDQIAHVGNGDDGA